jgi:hypothetical protein
MAIVAYPSEDLTRLHAKAWGNPWPRHTGTILRAELVSTAQSINEGSMDLDQDNRPVKDIYGGGFPIEIPDQLEYVCLDKILEVTRALKWISRARDVLVIRSEYEMLRRAIENIPPRETGAQGVVVTGQPGTGVSSSRF